MRTTLADAMSSRIPEAIGKCADDVAGVAPYINEAQQRLINAMGETGAWGGWYYVAFNVSRDDPYVTCPPDIARLVNMSVCRRPILINNQWYEFLWAGAGLQESCPEQPCGLLTREAYERNVVPVAYDLTASNQYLRIYLTDVRDVGKRILISQALDQNGNGIYSDDNGQEVDGFHLTLTEPFQTTAYIVTAFKGVSKPVTFGDVLLYQVDATSGDEKLLARYKPWETNPAYRRYYLHNLPTDCCNSGTPGTVQVQALAKLEYVPARALTDFLIIGNIPALKEECLAVRFGEMDTPGSMAQTEIYHRRAVKLLNQELTHYLGRERPAVGVRPFGTAHLVKQRIGVLI